jgi:hypothetical protein
MTARAGNRRAELRLESGGALADAMHLAGVTADKNGIKPRCRLASPLAAFRMYVINDHPGGDGGDNDQ